MAAAVRRTRVRRPQRGTSMIEVLVTLIVVAFALLGLTGFIARTNAVAVESNQRARALALLDDMAERIRSRKSEAALFAAAGVAHGAQARDCAALTEVARDLCDWNNLLFGTNDAQTRVGAVQALRFRGCVTQPFVGQPVYVVTVAWASIAAGTPPADSCALDAFGDDAHRRVVRTQVRIANLTA